MSNIFPVFQDLIPRNNKEKQLKQKSKVIWFTGLSGSGKTTLALALEQELFKQGYFTQILDGDNVRSGINNNLSFSAEDRLENIRRVAEVSKLIVNNGVICLCAFISPTEKIREMVRRVIGTNDLLFIHVNTPIETCEQRDIKGLYKKAREGEIKDFTGVSAPFEDPLNPFLSIDTSNTGLDDCVRLLLTQIIPELTLGE